VFTSTPLSLAKRIASECVRSRYLWFRLIVNLVIIVAMMIFLMPSISSFLHPQFDGFTSSSTAVLARLLVSLWWFVIANSLIIAGRIVWGINHHDHSARLASDLAAVLIYLCAALAVIDFVFQVSVPGVIATSGIIAIVVGLALQTTLSDVFSGVALGIDRPFSVGDIISIEGVVEGRVVQTNWRSVRIATLSNDMATVPNSIIAKSRVLNRSPSAESRRDTLKVFADPCVAPNDAIEILTAAALNAGFVAERPPPKVLCTDLRGDAAIYEVAFNASLAHAAEAKSDILQHVYRHAALAGLTIVPQNATPIMRCVTPGTIDILRTVHVLEALSPEDYEELAGRILKHAGDIGETIFEQGGSRASMYVIVRGAFEVSRDQGYGEKRFGTIGAGDYFGELALFTGGANAATVRALTRYEVIEITKTAIAPLLMRNENLLKAIEVAAAKAHALLDRTIAAQTSPVTSANTDLIDRIKLFFGI